MSTCVTSQNAEFVELKLAEGALDHVAGAICHKVLKLSLKIYFDYSVIFINMSDQINYFQLKLETVPCKPGTWSGELNRGGLISAPDQVEQDIRVVDRVFSEYHKDGNIQHHKRIRKRTTKFIRNHPECANMNSKVISLFVKIKLGHRVNYLNKTTRAERARELNKTRHFVC